MESESELNRINIFWDEIGFGIELELSLARIAHHWCQMNFDCTPCLRVAPS